jgi:hypothetical protein
MVPIFLCAVVTADALRAQSENFLPASGYSELVVEGKLSAQDLSGSNGWKGQWALPKSGPSPAYLYKESANLAPSAGGGVSITPPDDGVYEIGRRLTKSIPTKGNKAIYASFLLNVSEKKPQGMAYVLFSGIGGLGAGVKDGSLMVLSRQDTGVTEEGQAIKEWAPLLSQEYEPNKPYFFVVKISDGEDEWGATDEMEVWINPKDVSTEQAGSSNSLVNNTDSPGNIAPPSGSIGQVTLHVENLQGITVTFDDLRVGTTWESVTGPVAP